VGYLLAKKKTSTSEAGARVWVIQGLLLVLAAAGVVAGVVFLGQWGLEQLRGRERYALRFADIECVPPAGMSRAEFLDEVQYESRFPDRFGVLDEDISGKLSAAFAKHPWVEKVEGVLVTPPRQVEVKLVYRRPVLAVKLPEGLVAVDGQGVRLPKNAGTSGLPVFEGDAAPPQGPAGVKWGDPQVEARARQLGPR